ncbi:hypothetical protein B0H19DRAFT_1093554 [Mycena capillaripes]|nr:hypothetical protein B0H19DRAFT_1093554 [Mycena capillaripes]
MHFNYVVEPNSNLLCCICRMPFVEPVSTRTCSHTFCRDCIFQAISHAHQCPVDRSALSVDDLLPANSIIRSLVDELIVECIHRTSGCTHTCERQLLTAHVMDACPFSRVTCPKGECAQNFDRRDAESHTCAHTLAPCDLCGAEFQHGDLQKHLLECNDSPVTCEFCVLECPRSELTAHNDICSEALVPCPQASNGCGWTGPRATLASAHTPSCPYEAIKGFFALNTTKFERIAEENLILRHRVDTLESLVQTTKRELMSAKTALGPWFRPDGVYAYSRPSADLPPDLQPASASSSSPASRRFSVSFAGDAPALFDHAPAPPQDVLAAYFPSETPEERYRDVTERRRQTLPAGWEPPFGVGVASGVHSPTHSHTVAPLNLSTTLEGALAGVRASVVALAGAVDSLGRRSDIALTNETLRLNEEVMSLRANVHGLRMQVHTIMMDRNAQVTGRSGESVNSILGFGVGDGTWPLHPPGPRFYNQAGMSPTGQSITKL